MGPHSRSRLYHRNWKNMSRLQRLEDYKLQIKFSLRRLKENYKPGQNVQKELDTLHHYMSSPIYWAYKDDDRQLFGRLCAALGSKLQDEFPKKRNAAAHALIKVYNNLDAMIKQERVSALAQLKERLGVSKEETEETANQLFNRIFADVINK